MPKKETSVENDEAEILDPVKPSVGDEGEVETPKNTDKEEDETVEGEDAEGEDQEEDEDIDNPEIPVRAAASHVIARQRNVIKKLRSKDDEEGEVETDEEDEGDLTPELQAQIDRRIQQSVAPLQEALLSKADEDELDSLFAKEPDAKKYDKRIRAYMKHDAWKAVPPEAIYHHLNYQNSQATGARRKAAADLQAGQMRGAGSGSHPTKTKKVTASDIESMTDEEFDAFEMEQRKASRE